MKKLDFSRYKPKQRETTTASRPWQDKDNPYSVTNIIKRYGIKPPQTFRLWKLAKENAGFIETTVKGLEDGLKKDYKDVAGVLISKLLPKKSNQVQSDIK